MYRKKDINSMFALLDVAKEDTTLTSSEKQMLLDEISYMLNKLGGSA